MPKFNSLKNCAHHMHFGVNLSSIDTVIASYLNECDHIVFIFPFPCILPSTNRERNVIHICLLHTSNPT